MKNGLPFIFTLLLLSACQSDNGVDSSQYPTQPALTTSLGPGPISIEYLIPYQNENMVPLNIRQECNLPQQLSEYIHSYSEGLGIPVKRVDHVDSHDSGIVLVVEIINAISIGGALFDNSKTTTLHSKLYENGTLKGSFSGGKRSMGGLFSGLKGTCSVFDQTAKVLGQDIALWLKQPLDNARLGNL